MIDVSTPAGLILPAMTKLETRLLQLLSRSGGRMKQQDISQRMSRHTRAERDTALQLLEAQGLISSALQPTSSPGGRKGGGVMVFWLTPAGLGYVADARQRGEIRDKVAA